MYLKDQSFLHFQCFPQGTHVGNLDMVILETFHHLGLFGNHWALFLMYEYIFST